MFVFGGLLLMLPVAHLDHVDIDRILLARAASGLDVLDQGGSEVKSDNDVAIRNIEALPPRQKSQKCS